MAFTEVGLERNVQTNRIICTIAIIALLKTQEVKKKDWKFIYALIRALQTGISQEKLKNINNSQFSQSFQKIFYVDS